MCCPVHVLSAKHKNDQSLRTYRYTGRDLFWIGKITTFSIPTAALVERSYVSMSMNLSIYLE